MSRAEVLKRRADEAAQVRRYDTDPDVVAYRLERRAVLGTGLVWAGIVLGLAFTVPNVQRFVAGDAEPWSIVWTTAWLLDVMVSLPLIGVLVLEQAVTRHEVQLGVMGQGPQMGSLVRHLCYEHLGVLGEFGCRGNSGPFRAAADCVCLR